MIISEEELKRLHRKYSYPKFSKSEYDRRYRNIKNMMQEMNIDCILVIGGSASYGRLWFNVRYLTNMVGKAEICYYCLFPKEGLPCLVVPPGHSLNDEMLARTVVREIAVGRPDVLSAITDKLKEKGLAKGRIGIVEYDPYTSIPKNHWDFFTAQLQKAEFVFVTKEFLATRHIKSEEEIQFLERSAELGDIGIKALAENLKPGMTEAKAFAIVYEAVLSNGGEMGMIQLSSAPMPDTGVNDQRPRPLDRVIGSKDLLNNELGIFYNGYEAQTGKPIVTGPPSTEVKEMFELAMKGYEKVSDTLYPGKNSAESITVVNEIFVGTEYTTTGSLLQGMGGANPRHEPSIKIKQTPRDKLIYEGELIYKKGMVFTLQMHVIDKNKTKGLFLADTFAVYDNGPRCLNKLPPQLIKIQTF